MNKLIAVQISQIIAMIDISKMEKVDQYIILDDILICNKIADEAKKQGDAALNALSGNEKDKKLQAEKANKLISEKLESEKVEIKKISSAAFDLILKQDMISAGAKALLYQHIRKAK